MQTTDTVLMIRPVRFTYNAQTGVSNAFQDASQAGKEEQSQQAALIEFDGYVKAMKANGVNVIEVFDTPEPHTPDSIFPNNWVSFHEDGTIILYPMEAVNRRWERRRGILDIVGSEFEIKNEIDLTHYEQDNKFLEGTGSMTLDRPNKICYACISSRTNPVVLDDFAKKTGYSLVTFTSTDLKDFAVYHTNVMMCLGEKYSVICLDSIKNTAERAKVVESLQKTGKEIIEITLPQMHKFAGNMLEVRNNQNKSILAMSEQAFKALTPAQVAQIEKYSTIVAPPLYTIETNGGGSARCMLAEVFLPKKN